MADHETRCVTAWTLISVMAVAVISLWSAVKQVTAIYGRSISPTRLHAKYAALLP
jgi:hypothetical protein